MMITITQDIYRNKTNNNSTIQQPQFLLYQYFTIADKIQACKRLLTLACWRDAHTCTHTHTHCDAESTAMCSVTAVGCHAHSNSRLPTTQSYINDTMKLLIWRTDDGHYNYIIIIAVIVSLQGQIQRTDGLSYITGLLLVPSWGP